MQPGNSLPKYTQYAELSCAVCSLPDPKVNCPAIKPAARASVTCDNGNKYGSRYTFMCADGFMLSRAAATVSCLANKHWSVAIGAMTCLPHPEVPAAPRADALLRQPLAPRLFSLLG